MVRTNSSKTDEAQGDQRRSIALMLTFEAGARVRQRRHQRSVPRRARRCAGRLDPHHRHDRVAGKDRATRKQPDGIGVDDWFPTLAGIIGAKVPIDRPIDGVDQGAFITGMQANSNRESLITFIGAEVAGVRWRSFNDQSGRMRTNLYMELENWGVHEWLGYSAASSLFAEGWSDIPRARCTITRELHKEKGLARRSSRKSLIMLVGRVGIEPTTNGLRVRGTRAGAGRKPMKRNGRFAGTRTAAPRHNLGSRRSVGTNTPKAIRLAWAIQVPFLDLFS